MLRLMFMAVQLTSFVTSSENVNVSLTQYLVNASVNASHILPASLADINEGVAFGLCVAAIFLCLFAMEAMRGRLETKGKEIYANAATWGIFLILTAAGHVQSPNDPSIYITVGAAMQLLAITILILPARVYPRFPVEFGILMTLLLSMRIWVTSFFQGYLPNDTTGDGCIQLIEGVTLLLIMKALIREIRAKERFPWREIAWTTTTVVVSVVVGFVCSGDLDYSEEDGLHADIEYAIAMYMELAAWGYMLRFMASVPLDRAKHPTWLLPAFIQAVSRTYFWYSAIAATQIEKPIRLQYYFPWVIVIVHLCEAILISLVAMYANVDISKADLLMVPEESPV